MTQIADITVKNGASSPVNVVFTAYQPQSGQDRSVWLAKIGDTRLNWPSFTAHVSRTKTKSSKIRFNLTVPYFDTNNVQIGSIPFAIEGTIPDSAPPTIINDAQAYLSNLLTSTLVVEMIRTASPAI